MVLCGLITQYGNVDGGDPRAQWRERGAKTFERQQVQVHDLFVGNFVADYQDRFLQEMSAYVRSGEWTISRTNAGAQRLLTFSRKYAG